ncbi:MAG: hypothetical protein ACKVJK_22170 [Methylophagaceae bacterium]|jgi:hypothetical protein
MRLRTDYKYALIDEYYTHWNAFSNPDEFYSELVSLDQSVIKYFISKTSKVVDTKGMVARSIYSQNELWVVYYSNLKKNLKVIDDASKSPIRDVLEQNRFNVRSKIVSTKNFQH